MTTIPTHPHIPTSRDNATVTPTQALTAAHNACTNPAAHVPAEITSTVALLLDHMNPDGTISIDSALLPPLAALIRDLRPIAVATENPDLGWLVGFLSHVQDSTTSRAADVIVTMVELDDDLNTRIEDAARRLNMTPDDWATGAVVAHLQRHT